METLTTRQKQVARAIALGATKKEIACEFNISEETVSNHAKQIYEKTGARSVGQLSVWWFRKTYNIVAELDPFATIVGLLFFFLAGVNEMNGNEKAVRVKSRYAKTVKGKRGKRKDQDINNEFHA